MVGVVVLYLFSWIYDLDKALGNVTYFCVMQFELYRIFLSPIVGNSLLNTIIMGMFYPTMGSKMEWSMGSSLYLWLIGFITVVTNVAFNVCCLFLFMFGMPEAFFYSCSGFWVVLFGLITIECMQTPDAPRQIMFIPVQIPSKYFPLVLYVFFSLFSMPQLDFAIAIGIGYAFTQGTFDRFRPTSVYLESLESNGGVLHSISRSRGYVLAGGALGHDAWIATNQAQVTRDMGDASSRGAYAPVSQSGGGGGGGFGSNISGISSVNGSTSANGANSAAAAKQESFPGSGHKLASSANSGGQNSSQQAIKAMRAEKLGGPPV